MSVAFARPRAEAAADLITALLYRRVSLKEQATEGVSLGAQLDECRRYVVRQDWVLGDEFEDVETGRRDDRQDYQRLLLAIRGHRLAGRQVVLVVAALDRLGRNVAERVRCWEDNEAARRRHLLRARGRPRERVYLQHPGIRGPRGISQAGRAGGVV